MKGKLRNFALYIVGAVLSIGLGCEAAKANLILSPIYVDLTANRGKSEGVLNVGNSSNEAIRVRLFPKFFSYNRDGEFQELTESDERNLSPYLQFSPREIVVEPGKVRRVRLLSLLPPSLPDGEYRVAIFAETLSSGVVQSGYRVNLISRVGAAIYVRKGNVTSDLQVATASFNRENQQLRLLLRNQGQATARPKIQWSLKQGEKLIVSEGVGTSVVGGMEQNVLLNRNAQNKLNVNPGKYQLLGEVVWKDGDRQKTLPFNLDLDIP
ncbi:MAG TPA: P pilus assembly protein, chaperone PapD [Nostocaceae cyanobacterium]|nr:P pilus assembly protein, chaperone PapD [Nostocaceae cyanobacterium]